VFVTIIEISGRKQLVVGTTAANKDAKYGPRETTFVRDSKWTCQDILGGSDYYDDYEEQEFENVTAELAQLGEPWAHLTPQAAIWKG
jgi:hypothetical protein